MLEFQKLPGNKSVGKQSKYSMYRTAFPTDIGNCFNFRFDRKTIPVRNPELFKVMTFNLNRFPKSLSSETVLSAILHYSQPDVVFLQEVKLLHVLRNLIHIVNSSKFPANYELVYGINSANNFNTAILYNSNFLKISMKKDLFNKDHFAATIFPRLPLITKFKILNSEVYFINLHLISYVTKNHSAVRENCLILLREYFRECNFIDPVIIGGDWNIDSHSSILETYFPDFNRQISNFHSKSDYFLLLNDCLFLDELNHCLQYKMSVCKEFNISVTDYRKYVSDHFPVLFEFPVSVFK